MHTIRMPIDFRPVIQSFVAEQIKAMLTGPHPATDNFPYLMWETLFQQSAQAWYLRSAEEKTSRSKLFNIFHFGRKVKFQPVSQTVNAGTRVLPHSRQDFCPIHCR